jgi:hypothetical protein
MAKKKSGKKTTKSDSKVVPRCSKCRRVMELVDVVPEDGGRTLVVRHKCPKCVNMWSIRTRMAVSPKARDPKFSDMFK